MDREDIFLGIATLVLGYISYLMVKPFLSYVIAATILAFILRPVHLRFKKYIGDRISAFSLVVLAVLAAFIPFLITIGAVVNDAQDLRNNINSTEFINNSEIEANIQKLAGSSYNLTESMDSSVRKFSNSMVGGASAILRSFTNFFIGFTLMLFLLYYMIKDGGKLVKWLKEVIPIEEELQESYYDQLSLMTWAVVKGHVFVAIIQGIIAGLGLFVAGVPNYIFWTFVMVLLGFIPVIGTIVVWLPAAVYLFFVGELNSAFFLLVYGFIVVGATDNIIRPLVVDKEANLHPAAIIIGVLGGLLVFGAVGMFIGPIIIGAFKSIVLVGKNK